MEPIATTAGVIAWAEKYKWILIIVCGLAAEYIRGQMKLFDHDKRIGKLEKISQDTAVAMQNMEKSAEVSLTHRKHMKTKIDEQGADIKDILKAVTTLTAKQEK